MAMADWTVAVSSMREEDPGPPPALPEAGLREVFRDWSGPGELWTALAAASDAGYRRNWTRVQIESRAHRVLLQQFEASLRRWPVRTDAWLERLPAVSTADRFDSQYMRAGVSWTRTIRRYGWPPSSFLGRQRNRAVDSLLVTTMKWTLERLAVIRASARLLLPAAGEPVRRQLEAALALLNYEPVAGAEAIRPSAVDMRALRAEGAPWSYVGKTAALLRRADVSLLELSRCAVYPQPRLRGRLFHLAVLGLVIQALRELNYVVTSRRPLGAPSMGPAYSCEHPTRRSAHLWFEASGAWSYYGRASPYVEVTRGIAGAGNPLGADLMLVVPDRNVLLIECKYSRDAQIVARGGYEQAVAYAAEAASRLAPGVFSVVVGPDEVVKASHRTTLSVGTIAMASAAEVDVVVRDFVSAQ